MKKVILAAVIGLITVALFFFSGGEKKLIQEAKKQLSQELQVLSQHGFEVKTLTNKEKEDHFILSIHDPQKVAAYLTMLGNETSAEDIAPFKGTAFGADVHYLKDTYSAISTDIYPVTLPARTYERLDKTLQQHIQRMIKNKKLLVHIDVAKDFQHFKGYLKDINETLRTADDSLHLQTKGWRFSAQTDQGRITQIHQEIQQLLLSDAHGINTSLEQIESLHQFIGPTLYDINTTYRIGRIHLKQEGFFSGELDDITLASSNRVLNGLLHSKFLAMVQRLKTIIGTHTLEAKALQWDMAVDNIDIATLEKLQQIDPTQKQKIQEAFSQLLAKDIRLTIDHISVLEVIEDNRSMGGMQLKAALGIDKQADLYRLVENPLLLLRVIDADISLNISDAIFARITKDPRAMLVMMFLPPQGNNGQKRYTIIIKKGKTTINGVSF